MNESPEERRAIVRAIAAGCRERGLHQLAADLDALAIASAEPTEAGCQRILERHRRELRVSQAQYRILQDALSFN